MWLCNGRGRAFCTFGAAAQLILASALITPLTYVAAATDLPLQDANLALADRMLGLDWAPICISLISGRN